MSCNAQWALNVDALAQTHFLTCVELWGHGDSPAPTTKESYSLPTYFAQFEAIREELAVQRWAVIGQSYGAGIMINYALAHPQICTAVVATNSRSAFSHPTPDNPRPKAPSTPPADLRELPFHPIHARRFPEGVKQALVAKADAMTPETIRLSGRLGGQLNSRHLLAELPMPLLITNGKYEKSFQKDLASLLDASPELNVVHLEGGHSVNIEAAEEFNAAVSRFLA